MQTPIRTADRQRNLEELRRYRLLDTPPDEGLDDLTALAAHICAAPMAVISLLDEGRLWFKSKVGLTVAEIPRTDCFCEYTVGQRDGFVIPDTTKDPRFSGHPLVSGDTALRFYAGIPLITPDGHTLGALCVLDTVPRQLAAPQIESLQRLARQVMARFEQHRWKLELAEKNDIVGIVTENARVGLAVVDRDRRYLYASGALGEILGRPLSEIVGQRVPDLLEEIYEVRIKALLDRAFSGERVAFETPLPSPRSDRYFTVTYEPRLQDGDVRLVVAVITDITPLKRAQTAQQEAERLAKSTIDALSSHICVIDGEGTVIATNEAWRHFGTTNSRPNLHGNQSENYLEVCDSAKGPEAAEAKAFAEGIRRVLRGEKQEFTLEYPCHSPWQKRWFIGHVTRFPGEGPVRLVVAHEDVTKRKEAEIARLESLERLQIVAQATSDAIWDWNLRTNALVWNDGICRLFGHSLGDLPRTADSWSGLVHPDDLDRARLTLRSAIDSGGCSWTLEYRFRRCDGTYADIQDCGSILRDAKGKAARVIGAMQDVTERNKADRSAKHLAAIVESSDDAIISKSLDGTITSWNRGAENLFGYPASEIIGKSILLLIPADRGAEEHLILGNVKEGRNTCNLETRRLHRDGRLIDVCVTTSPIRDSSGGIIGVSKIAHDISSRKNAENALRASEEMLRRVTDNTSIGLVVVDRERRFTYCNTPFQKMTGMTKDQIIGAHVAEVEKAIYEDHIRPVLDRVFLGERLAHEVARQSKDGIHHVLARLEPIVEDGVVTQVVAVISDITGFKQAERAVRESEERLRAATDAARVGLVMVDTDFRYTYANPAYSEMLRLPPGDLVGRRVADVLPGVFGEQVRPRLERGFCGEPVNYELTIPSRTPDEGPRTYSVAYRLTNRRGRPEVVVVLMDITQMKEADLALRESEARFRQLAENIEEVFWITDPAMTTVLYVSPAYEKIWGRTCKSVYESPRTWIDAIHPDDRDRIAEAATKKQALGTYDETYRIQRPDGTERWIRDRAYPLKGGDGEIPRIVGTATDITSQRQLEEQFRQAQKMEAVGQLAGGVAHDFNNILAAMMMQADLAGLPENLPAESREFLDDIKASAERAAKLTRQLLAFSRRQVMQPRDIDLNDLVTSISKMLMRTLGEDVRLHLDLHSRPLLAHADAGMIDQVLLNLVVNARDAMPNGGRLVIETSEAVLSPAEALAIPETAPGRYACLRVSDTGSGIAPALLGRIFEPFFTTKDAGKGTGLGLATVFGIVKQHGGSVTVQSTVGIGTTFRILLPLVADSGTAKDLPVAKAKPRGGTETILVVEDEHALRLMTRFVLERAGYTVLEAADGVEALKVWETHRDSVQLLLTDIVMPEGISGRDLAERLRKLKPDLRVIFTSGYSAEIAGRELSLLPGQNFVQKPAPPDQLLDTIRQSLDR